MAFRLQRKRALAAAVARLEVALQEDAALAELEALEGDGEEVPPPGSAPLRLCTRLLPGIGGASGLFTGIGASWRRWRPRTRCQPLLLCHGAYAHGCLPACLALSLAVMSPCESFLRLPLIHRSTTQLTREFISCQASCSGGSE